VLSTLTGDIRKLADDGFMAAFSPDGRQVAYITGLTAEIWLMGPKGENPRRVVSAGAGGVFSSLSWSPDGTRLACLKFASSDFSHSTVEIRDLVGGPPEAVVTAPRVSAATWAPDGRLLFARGDPAPTQESYGLWELALDPQTAKPAGAPRQLAAWLSQSVGSMSVSRDGRRVMMTRGRTRSNVYVGEVSAVAGLTNVRQVTEDDRVNWPSAWTPDGRAVLFHSDRNGDFDLLRQGLTDREAQTVLLGPEEDRLARISPDGKWLLYLAQASLATDSTPMRIRVMRMPAGGGPAEAVLETAGNWGRGEAIVAVDGDYNWSFPDFRCPAAPGSGPCVIAEAAGPTQTVFTAFDPVSGRKGEVARVDLPVDWLAWDLSPDGTRVAYATFAFFSFSAQPLRVLTLADKSERKIPLKNWLNPTAITWAPSGQEVYVTNWSVRGGTLFSVDMTGRLRVLRDLSGKGLYLGALRPSPDGRLLAFGEATAGSNAWVLDAQQR